MTNNKNNLKNNLNDFNDLNDEIIIKEDDKFQVFSHGNLLDLNSLSSKKSMEFSNSKELLDTGMEEIVLAPPVPMVWDKKSNFYFDIQDEIDIAQEAKKIEQMTKKETNSQNEEPKKYSLNKILQKILENYNLNLLPDLEKRLSSVILSFLKHTRSKVDVLNLFKAPINQSGLALGEDIAIKLIDLLNNIRSKIDEVGGIIIEDIKKKEPLKVNKSQEQVKNLANFDPRQIIKPKIKKSTLPLVKRVSVSHHKQLINDIKKKERVLSPVDEFSEITLLTFRRLSEDPVEAAQKIMDKIMVLEKESYLKKALAIKNWRKSEIYNLYLDLGRESMEKNIPIDKVIKQKVLNKEKVLTKKEFSAITDLNKKMRF